MELYSIGVHLLYLIFHSFIFGFTLCDIWVKYLINILQLFFALLQRGIMIRATQKFPRKCYTVDESSLGTKVGISYIQSITQKVVKAETRDRIYRLYHFNHFHLYF